MEFARSQRAYRLLLLLLPKPFRHRHGAEIEAGFAEMLYEARRRRGRRGVPAALLAATWDLLRQLPRLRRPARPLTAGRVDREASSNVPRRGGSSVSGHSIDGPPSRRIAPTPERSLRAALDGISRELGQALRSLLRSPAFTVIAVVTLALGIGLNTAVFSVVNGVLVRPLPFPEPERLVQLWGAVEGEPTVWGQASVPDLEDWRAATTSFDALAGFADERMPLGGTDEPALVEVGRVTGQFFDVLGVEAALGRTIGADDFRSDAPSPVVVSHTAWRDRFGADAGVLGWPIRLDDESYTVIGVLPPVGRALPSNATEFWIRQQPEMQRGSRSLSVVGRLAECVSLAAAQADVDAVTAALAAAYPDSNADRSVRLVPLKQIIVGDGGRLLLVLFGATGFVLIIAAANIVNLFHSRALDRRRELALRTALGASRVRLLAHVGAEALLLALFGGAVGVLAAYGAVDAFVALAPADLPRLDEVAVDGATLAFAIAVSLAMALLVGLAPALRSSVARRPTGRTGSPRRDWRGWLIATEVALSVVLVVGAGLLARSFARLQAVDKGFAPDHVLSLRLTLPASRYPGAPDVLGFHEGLLDRLEALPGVASVGGVTVLPFTRGNLSSDVAVDGSERDDISVEFRSMSHDYFTTMGMALISGRSVGAEDTPETLPAAVINRTLAQRAWPGADPLGRTITIFERTWTVVGVVNDVRHFGLDVPPGPQMYVSFRQQPRRYLTYALRASGDPADLVPTVRELVHAADPELPIDDLATMNARVWLSAAAPRFRTSLLGVLASTAMLLAVVGVYGVASFSVSRRSREIGIRRALGARSGNVMGLVVGRGMFFAVIGAGAGAALAAALTGSLRGLLFEVEPLDVPTFVAALAAICGAALLGCLVPALRAAAVDPLAAIVGDGSEHGGV